MSKSNEQRKKSQEYDANFKPFSLRANRLAPSLKVHYDRTKKTEKSSSAGPEVSETSTPRSVNDCVYKLADILKLGLDKNSLDICIKLIDLGVNPFAVSHVIDMLRTKIDEQKEKDKRTTPGLSSLPEEDTCSE